MPVKTQRTAAEIKAEIAQQQSILLAALEERRSHEHANRVYFFHPYAWMRRALELIRLKNIVVVPAPNKLGKTCLNACLMDSWCRGYEAWNEVDKDHPEAVKDTVDGEVRYFRSSSLGVKPPVKIRISGEDWYKHFGETVLPEMRKWLPIHEYDLKKNSMGFDYKWTHKKTGSTIELITYNQDVSATESWMGHAWIPDEPPPKSMFSGMSRGIFLCNGKVYMPITPLKEAWILDELLLSGRRDVGVIDDLTILANDDAFYRDTEALTELGLDKEQVSEFFDLMLFKDKPKRVFVEDQGRNAEKYLESVVDPDLHDKIGNLKFLRFVKDTPVEQAATRFGGQFKSLVGRVLKNFRKELHWIDPFKIPTDWPVEAFVDIAMSKPQAIAYHTVNKQDLRYIIKERYEHLSGDEIADALIRDKSRHAWRLRDIYIDPLAKGDSAYMKNQFGDVEDTFTKIENKIKKHGMRLHIGSKDKPSGVANINEALKGPNGIPTYYIFNTCKRHYLEVMRWVWDEQGRPAKAYDDMMENWYRATLTGLKYTDVPRNLVPSKPDYSGDKWMAM